MDTILRRTKLCFHIILYDSMLHCTRIKKITREHLSGFTGLCILHWTLLLISVYIGELTAYLLKFGPKLTVGKYDVAVL